MRKFLISSLAAFALFSCSNESENQEPAKELRAVSFNVKSKSFEVEVNPMSRSLGYVGSTFFQYIIYNEAGDVLVNKVLPAENIGKGTLAIEEKLEEGKYHVSMVSGNCSNPSIPDAYYVQPSNYFTDYYVPNSSPSSSKYDNEGSYYETFELTVTEQNEIQNVKLSPMWSKLRVELNNLRTIEIPQGADHVELFVHPYPRGYSLSTKLADCFVHELDTMMAAHMSMGNLMMEMPVSQFLEREKIESRLTVAATDKNPGVYLRFFKSSLPGEARKDLKSIKLIDVPMTDNNKEYYVHGEVEPDDSEDKFKVEQLEFVGEEVDVPFTGIQ